MRIVSDSQRRVAPALTGRRVCAQRRVAHARVAAGAHARSARGAARAAETINRESAAGRGPRGRAKDAPSSLGLHTVRSIMPVFWVAIILLFWTVWGSIPGTRLLGGSCAECGSEKYRSSIFDISARVVSAVGKMKNGRGGI